MNSISIISLAILTFVASAIAATELSWYPTPDEVAFARKVKACSAKGKTVENCITELAGNRIVDPVRVQTIINYDAVLDELNEFFAFKKNGGTLQEFIKLKKQQTTGGRKKRNWWGDIKEGVLHPVESAECESLGIPLDRCHQYLKQQKEMIQQQQFNQWEMQNGLGPYGNQYGNNFGNQYGYGNGNGWGRKKRSFWGNAEEEIFHPLESIHCERENIPIEYCHRYTKIEDARAAYYQALANYENSFGRGKRSIVDQIKEFHQCRNDGKTFKECIEQVKHKPAPAGQRVKRSFWGDVKEEVFHPLESIHCERENIPIEYCRRYTRIEDARAAYYQALGNYENALDRGKRSWFGKLEEEIFHPLESIHCERENIPIEYCHRYTKIEDARAAYYKALGNYENAVWQG